tara:strand:+ start:2557 stop:2826 length:270 start_codon:yes stop_codon:yes gene_type:complete
MVKKRNRLEIIRDILTVVRNKKQIKPTRLLHSSNLSPQMFKEYINRLLDNNFIIEKEMEKKKYILLSKRGVDFLKEYKIIEEFIQNFGL